MAELILVRHGETAWSRAGRHTGLTDIPLDGHGEQEARAVAPWLEKRTVVSAYCSPLGRARRTASLIGLPDAEPDPDLVEWDYGGYEGITTAEIHRTRPDWYLWHDGVVPGDADHPGESVEHVGERADRVLDRARGALAHDRGDVVLIGHGHALRVLAARWLGLPAAAGAYFRLDTATVSVLGREHGRPVFVAWNVPASD